ncbi:hypothetical protein RCL1_008087 [Eukaryota sp. TZLM3-RCL]
MYSNSLPSSEWKAVCQILELKSKTCMKFQCKLCDNTYSVNKWSMESHYVPGLNRQVSLCPAIEEPEHQSKVLAIQSYIESNSKTRKRRSSTLSPSVASPSITRFLSPPLTAPTEGDLPKVLSPVKSTDSSSASIITSPINVNSANRVSITANPYTTTTLAFAPRTYQQPNLTSSGQRKDNDVLDETVVLYGLGEALPLTKVCSLSLLQTVVNGAVQFYQKHKKVYQVPSYTKLMNSVAPRVVKNVKDYTKEQLDTYKETGFALTIDGAEINGNSLINSCLVAPGISIFLKAVEVNCVYKDINFLLGLFKKVITEVGESLVNIVVTDAATNYLNAAEKIKEIFPRISGVRCALHTMNSFLRDLFHPNSELAISKLLVLARLVFV